jgi:hypothetical protein
MPPTDRLSLPSHRRTLPPNRLAHFAHSSYRAQRHSATRRAFHYRCSRYRATRFGPLEAPVHNRRSHSIPIAGTTVQRFSRVPSMLDSLGVEVPYPARWR